MSNEEAMHTLSEENRLLRRELRIAHEAADVNARLVINQFEESERLLYRLHAAHAQHKAVLDATASVSIIAMDHDGLVQFFNSGAEAMLGYRAAEVEGKVSPTAFHLQAELEHKAQELSETLHRPVRGADLFLESAREGLLQQEEWTYLRKDGSTLPVSLAVTPLVDAEGTPKGCLLAATDLSHRKRAEREILEAMRAAEEANRTKSTFLANMSHELRTPLNAIIGYSEMLQEDAGEIGRDDFVSDLDKILAAARHLLALINDVLDLSKIEAGKMDLFLERFDGAAMIDDVVTTVQPLVEQNHNRLEVAVDGLGTLVGDVTRTRQVLFNLLSNACKFTEHGRVSLTARRDGERIEIRVSDTGIGLSEEQQRRLFRPFSQGESSTTRKYGGTGLGLAISRRFCEMMGGTIAVESAEGEGSTFTVRLPARVDRPVAAPAPPAAKSVPRRRGAASSPDGAVVLVIDDDPTVLDLMGGILGREGFRVVAASTGVEGLRLARELRPAVITLDVLLPGTDGWAILRQLKADPELAQIPVVMLTIVEDRNMGYALGADDHLTKPVERERLVAVVRKYAGGRHRRPVLVVEDDDAVREIMVRTLERDGWQVRWAPNGRVALERVAEGEPGLILLDLMMPEMDGFEFIAELRKNEAWRAIPVIVVTAKDLSEEEQRTRLDGFVERVLQKGAYSKVELLQEVRDLVVRYAAQQRTEHPPAEIDA